MESLAAMDAIRSVAFSRSRLSEYPEGAIKPARLRSIEGGHGLDDPDYQPPEPVAVSS